MASVGQGAARADCGSEVSLYEQVQRERLTDRIVDDIYDPPLEKTVMLVDLRPRLRRMGGRCGVRVVPPTALTPAAALRATQDVRPSKDWGS